MSHNHCNHFKKYLNIEVVSLHLEPKEEISKLIEALDFNVRTTVFGYQVNSTTGSFLSQSMLNQAGRVNIELETGSVLDLTMIHFFWVAPSQLLSK